MQRPLRDPFLQMLSEQLAESGYPVSTHASADTESVDWLESTLPECFNGQDVGLRWLSLDDQSDAAAEDDDDEPLPALALIRIDALLPFPIDSGQWELTLGALEMFNDLLPFGALILRPQAQCWAWQYTIAAPAVAFNGLFALRVIDTLRFYMDLLSPALIEAFARQDEPEAFRESIRHRLAEWAEDASGESAGAQS